MVQNNNNKAMTPEQIQAAVLAAAEQGLQAETTAPEGEAKADISEPKSTLNAETQEQETQATAEQPEAHADAFAVLNQQLAAKDEQIVDLKVQLKTAEASLATAAEATEGLAKIVASSISNMSIAMGGSAVDTSKLSAAELLAEHSRVAQTFANKFKAGGVAATVADEEARPAARSRRQAAALAATKLA